MFTIEFVFINIKYYNNMFIIILSYYIIEYKFNETITTSGRALLAHSKA